MFKVESGSGEVGSLLVDIVNCSGKWQMDGEYGRCYDWVCKISIFNMYE